TPICARRVRSRPARRPHRRARQLAGRRGSEPIKRTRGRACRNGICCRCRRARGGRACRSRSAAGRKSSRSKDSADVARQRAHSAMTEVNRAITSELLRPRVANAGLEVGPTDVLLAFMTFAGSLGVLLYGLSAIASFPIFLALHFVALAVPAAFVTRRARADGELTIPVLLLLATFASGPVGALGCAVLALALWWRNPSPVRLRHWYDYIAGVVARSRVARIYDEIVSGRLPSDPAATVPRFGPILQVASVEDQQ